MSKQLKLILTIALAYLLGGLAALLIGYRAAGKAARRKLRLIVAGSGADVLNLILLVIWENFFQTRFPNGNDFLRPPLLLTLPLIPLSFAYAIWRHQVIPVSLMLRRGVRYVLVSRGSVLLEALITVLVVTGILTLLFTYLRPSGMVIGMVSSVAAIAAWKLETRLHERYLAPVIDRRFFRQAYDAHQIIADLADSLRTTTNLPELLELVATKIQSALQMANVTVFLRDDKTRDFVSQISCRYDEKTGHAVCDTSERRLPHDAETLALLDHSSQPLDVELADEDAVLTARLRHDADKPSVEWQTLAAIDATLLLPLCAKDGLIGVISSGPSLGDLPFSSDDKRLLMSIAGPVTFALENARLVKRMVEEAKQHFHYCSRCGKWVCPEVC